MQIAWIKNSFNGESTLNDNSDFQSGSSSGDFMKANQGSSSESLHATAGESERRRWMKRSEKQINVNYKFKGGNFLVECPVHVWAIPQLGEWALKCRRSLFWRCSPKRESSKRESFCKSCQAVQMADRRISTPRVPYRVLCGPKCWAHQLKCRLKPWNP